jgi:peptide/nickel transport system ATP-binding protein
MTETATPESPAIGDDPDVLVDVRGVEVHFPIKRGVIFDKVIGYVYAVDGVDLQIRRGETYGLVGESGCGKSTLGKAILNLEPPTAGSVIFDGTDIASLKGEELRRKRKDIQMVFQDPMSSLDPRQSVESLLVEGMRAHGLDVDGPSTTRRLRELLAAVGLPAASLRKYPHEFSGGQRQRIGIARALSVEPKLIVADEPVSALDVSVQAQVLNLMQELQQKFGISYLLISHDLAVVNHLCDEVCVLHRGLIVERGAPQQLFAHAEHPYSQALLAAVPRAEPAALA